MSAHRLNRKTPSAGQCSNAFVWDDKGGYVLCERDEGHEGGHYAELEMGMTFTWPREHSGYTEAKRP